jgi:hypothetical protein
MSERETTRTALSILGQQVIQLTFTGVVDSATGRIFAQDNAPKLLRFIDNFEALLKGIKSLTHGSFPSSVKKTMLQSQLRGAAAEWAWNPEAHQFAGMDYDEFKAELKRHWADM